MTNTNCDLTVGADPSEGVVIVKARDEGGRYCIDCLFDPNASDDLARALREAAGHITRGDLGGDAERRGWTINARSGRAISVLLDRGEDSAKLCMFDVTELRTRLLNLPVTVELAGQVASWLEGAAAAMRAHAAGEIDLTKLSGRLVGRAWRWIGMADYMWTKDEETRLAKYAKAMTEAFEYGKVAFRQVEEALKDDPHELVKARALYTIEEV
jgi:hypothetical protein